MGDTSTNLRRPEVNFAFAFNDLDFSDRILRLEITPDDEDIGNADSGKKLRAEKLNNWFSFIKRKVEYSNWFFWIKRKGSRSSDGAKVTTLHICSLILAEKSAFFYKMFKNGMRESQQKNEVSLKINASEEATLMDLFRFMYGNGILNATSFTELVELLIAADKFEVVSCMSYCVEMLLKFPMSLELALSYLELPSSVLVSEIVKPLIDASKQFVVALYKDFTQFQEEAVELPLSAIQVVLESEGLQVESEDTVCDFVLQWARTSYTKLEERREILTKRLAPLIRFSNLSTPKLKEVLACADFDHDHLSKLVLQDLLLSRSNVHLIFESDSVEISTTQCSSAGRASIPHCVVFFNLTKQECAGLGLHKSAKFRLGGKKIYLKAECRGGYNSPGVFVMPGSENCNLDFQISVMKMSSMEFESMLKVKNKDLPGNGWGKWNIFRITRTEFLSDNSDYFINGVLRLKVELTLNNS